MTSPNAIAWSTVPAWASAAKAGHQVLQLFGMARGEQHRVAGLDPQTADRAADMTRADDADARLAAVLRQQAHRRQRRCDHRRRAGADQDAAAAIDTTTVWHGNLLFFCPPVTLIMRRSTVGRHHGCVRGCCAIAGLQRTVAFAAAALNSPQFGILLNQQNCGALGAKVLKDRENLLHHQRRQADRRFVDQQQLGIEQQPARDFQHFLLAVSITWHCQLIVAGPHL